MKLVCLQKINGESPKVKFNARNLAHLTTADHPESLSWFTGNWSQATQEKHSTAPISTPLPGKSPLFSARAKPSTFESHPFFSCLIQFYERWRKIPIFPSAAALALLFFFCTAAAFFSGGISMVLRVRPTLAIRSNCFIEPGAYVMECYEMSLTLSPDCPLITKRIPCATSHHWGCTYLNISPRTLCIIIPVCACNCNLWLRQCDNLRLAI